MHINHFIFTLLLITAALFAELREVTIIQTTDTHAQFRPDTSSSGSIIKAASIIRSLRPTPQHALLIDCGDTAQGSIAATLSRGDAGLFPLKLLNYDVWVPGNHEFDYGLDQFRHFTRLTSDILLCANLTLSHTPPFKQWKLFYRNDVAIAVIGLAPVYQKNWLLKDEADQIEVTPGVQVLQELLPDILKCKPDIIIVAAHQGWFRGNDKRGVNEIHELSQRFPEVDIFLGGHTHRIMPGNAIGQRSWYVQAAAHATHVARIHVTVDTEKHKVTNVSSLLIPVDDDTPEDPLLRDALKPFLEREDAERKRPVKASLTRNITARGTPGVSCQTSEFICQAIAETAHAEIVFHSRLSRKDLIKGPLTMGDLYELIPYENTIVTAKLTAEDITAILNEQWKLKTNYSYNGIYGAHATLKGERLELDEPFEGRRLTAFHSHAAAGSGRFPKLRAILQRPESELTVLPMTTRQAVVDFLAAHNELTITATRWIKTK